MSPFAAAAALLMASTAADPSAARVAGMARAWGYVKYVHPAMATSRIDWDGAFLRALPAAERASSDDEYRAVIATLLAELGDPVTRLLNPQVEPAPAPTPEPNPVRIEMVGPQAAVLVIPNDRALEGTPGLRSEVCARVEEAARFERVVLDLRGAVTRKPGWELTDAITQCLPLLLDRDVTLAPARFLTHALYMMQSIHGGPGGGLGPWESGLTTVSSGSVRGQGRTAPRLAIIVDRGTGDLHPLLIGLQSAGLAAIVADAPVPEAGVMVATFEVEPGLSISVRHGEWLRSDGGAGLLPDAVAGTMSAGSAIDLALALTSTPRRERRINGPVSASFRYNAFVEDDFSETPYPDPPHRLLALARLYAVIEYFFPYKDLTDRPWAETLLEFVPRMRDARDATDYALAVAELTTRIQDPHVTVSAPALDAYFGTHRPPARVDLIEGQVVVTEIPETGPSGLRVGDVVVSVDGEDALIRRQRLRRYLAASTAGRLENKIDAQFLLGPLGTPAALEIRGEDGQLRRATLERTLSGPAPRSAARKGPGYAVLPGGYGYIDLARLDASDTSAAFETIRDTPALVLDMRGYPSSGARSFVTRLAPPGFRPTVLGGLPRYDGTTGSFWLDEKPWRHPESASAGRYGGKVVVLVDAGTQSAAEHICALIKSVAKATFVGAQTSGADGGVTRTILPGGIVVNFTGQSVRHADGGQLQRVGIVPDVNARPTLRGIREGRDEVLARALEFIEGGE
jgi:C-terminal processing protease CtpA/Prc